MNPVGKTGQLDGLIHVLTIVWYVPFGTVNIYLYYMWWSLQPIVLIMSLLIRRNWTKKLWVWWSTPILMITISSFKRTTQLLLIRLFATNNKTYIRKTNLYNSTFKLGVLVYSFYSTYCGILTFIEWETQIRWCSVNTNFNMIQRMSKPLKLGVEYSAWLTQFMNASHKSLFNSINIYSQRLMLSSIGLP